MARGFRIGHPRHYVGVLNDGSYAVAGQDATFVYTPAVDNTPNQFIFVDQTSVALSSTITSAPVTISGLGTGVSITLNASSGTIDKNGDGNFLGSQIVQNGDTVRAQVTSSSGYLTAVNCVVVASPSGVQDTFTATTQANALTPITASLAASITSGVAPLGVVFDATGTTHSNASIDTFRSLGYSFNFADPSAGTWTYYGVDRSKNVFRGGPMTGHCFETPGTYTVKVKARDSSGNTDQTSITITVTDPDTVYSGANTVCITTGASATGGPAGCTYITNATSWPASANNTRYLLKRGDDFRSFGAWSWASRTGSYLGAYGAGAKPIIDRLTGTYSSCRRVDIDCRSSLVGAKASGTIGEDIGTGSFNVYSRVDWSNGALFAVVGSDGGTTGMARRGNVFYDCTVASTAGTYPNNTGYGMYFVAGSKFAFLGWSFNSNLNYHPIRIPRGYKGVFQHCLFAVTNGDSSGQNGYDLFKWHAAGLDTWPEETNVFTGISAASQYGSIEENQFGNGTEAFSEAVTIEPQNDQSAEGMQDFMMARNKFLKNFGTDFALGGRRLTARGNYMSSPATGSPNYNTNHHAASLPTDWRGPYNTTDSDPTFEDPT